MAETSTLTLERNNRVADIECELPWLISNVGAFAGKRTKPLSLRTWVMLGTASPSGKVH